MSVSAFVLTLPFTAIQQGFFRYRSIYNRKRKGREMFSAMVVGVSLLILIYALISLAVIKMFVGNGFWYESFLLVSAFITSEIYKVFTRVVINADRDRAKYASSIIAEFVFKGIFVLGLFVFNEDVTVESVVLAYVMANVISFIVCVMPVKSYFKYVNLKQLRLIWLRIIIFSMPLLLWAGFGWFRDMSMRWFLDVYTTKSEVAIFTALSSLAVIVPMIIQTIVGAYFIPVLYSTQTNKEKEEAKKKLNDLVNILVILGILAFPLLYIFSGEIILLATDQKYVEYSWGIPWMFLSNYLYACGMVNASSLLMDFKAKKMMLPNVLSGLVVMLGGMFVKDFGVHAAIVTYCISYCMYFVCVKIVLYRSD